jgi:hypothetical protein
VATILVPEVVDDVGARVFIPAELAGDVLAVVRFPVAELMVVVGSEDMEVGIAIETAVAFPAVKREVGTVASGDAVRGSLKMLQISAMAPKVAEVWSARGKACRNARNCGRQELCLPR